MPIPHLGRTLSKSWAKNKKRILRKSTFVYTREDDEADSGPGQSARTQQTANEQIVCSSSGMICGV